MRKYIIVSILGVFVGAILSGLFTICTVFDWVDSVEDDLARYCGGRAFLEHTGGTEISISPVPFMGFEDPPIVGDPKGDIVKTVLVRKALELAIMQKCLDNATPFVLGISLVSVLGLQLFERRRRHRKKGK